MALDIGNLMLQLRPGQPIDLGNGGGGMERERLKLQREEFEALKEHREEQRRLDREAEAGQMARARLTAEKEQKDREATVAAQLQKDKLAAFTEFTKLNGQGDIEGARAMVPMMTSLGMGVDLEGEVDGLPRYRIEMDAAAAAAEESARAAQTSPFGPNETAEQSLSRLSGMGLSDETGSLDDPSLSRAPSVADVTAPISPAGSTFDPQVQAAISETPASAGPDAIDPAAVQRASSRLMPPGLLPAGDPFNLARAAMAESEVAPRRADGSLQPTRAPDEPDYTGSVPKNVLDMSAIQAQTLARLDPTMAGITAGYPESHRAGAESTAMGLRSSGLPLAKQLEAFDKAQGGVDSAINANLMASAQKEKREGPSFMEQQSLDSAGWKRGKEIASAYKIGDMVTNRDQYKVAYERLTNKSDADDYLVGALISRRMGERGATTEPDVERALGTASMSFFDRIHARLYKEAIGGLELKQKNSLIKVLKDWEKADHDRAVEYLDQIETEAARMQPDKAEGMRAYARTIVPRNVRDEHEARKKAARGPESTTPSAADPNFDRELDAQAQKASLNPANVRAAIRGEGGKADAVNQFTGKHGGILQISQENWPALAKAVGTPDVTWEDMLKMSRTQQLPYVMQYLKGTGLTDKDDAGEYAMATFMPAFRKEADSFVLGKKDSPEIAFGKVTKGTVWEQNPGLRDGDVITVGGVKSRGRELAGGADKAKPVELKPKTAEDAKIVDILNRRR